MSPPLVSVVVPVHDVEQYLPACLDSLLTQTWSNLEIVCVDDGSTDRTPEVIRTYAELDRRVRVLRIDNAGLGNARNVGLAATTGEYAMFVDGDDTVPTTAVARMASTLAHTGSDLVTGRVMRLSGVRTWPSALHERAHPRHRLSTHISATPSLLHDTTAWNKLYRRDFWDSQQLAFPVGRLYEDIPVMMRAHVLASAVDVIGDVVYNWRRREDGSRSITQRRYEVRNLEDRVASLLDVRQFLTDQALPRLRDLHDRKALGSDFELYLREFLGADEEWRRRFVELVGGFASGASEQVLARLAPALRVKYHLAGRGETERLAQVLQHERDNGGTLPKVRRGASIRLDVGPAAPAVPRRLTALRRSLPLRAGVDRVRWRDGKLVVEGYAFVDAVPGWRLTTLRRLRFTESGGGRSFSVWLRPRAHPQVVAALGRPGRSYRHAGFRAVVPARRLTPRGSGGVSWDVVVQVLTPFAHRGAALGPPRSGSAWFTPPHRGKDGVLHTTHWSSDKWLTLRATSFTAFVADAELDPDGRQVRLVLNSPDTGSEPPQSVVLRSRTGTEPVELPIAGAATDGTTGSRIAVTVPFDDLAVQGEQAPWTAWRMSVRTATRDLAVGTDRAATLVGRSGAGTGEVRANRRGQVEVVTSGPKVLVERAEWRGRLLRLSGVTTLPEGVLPGLRWANTRGDRLDSQEVRDGDRYQSVVDTGALPGPDGPRPIPAGRWTLTRELPDGRRERVAVARGRQPDVEREGAAGPDDVRLWVDRKSLPVMSVYAVAEPERGKYNQARLQEVQYTAARKRPPADLVLLESWHGKQFSDNPRGLVEEALRRRAAGAAGSSEPELVVSVRDASVVVPEGVRAVRRWSREYYETLGTARLVISNDSMFPGFVKRPDQKYLQTWHGTPLKRVGFDIERIHFRNKGYLDDFAREVARWDWLVSPNRYTSDVLRTAFRYGGEILETGYPRNDVFSRPEAAAERERVREYLGLAPDVQVALWTPTWRDNQFDTGGGYAFPLALDPAQVEKQLGPGHVILYRGHHLVADSVGALSASGGTFVNVSGYPDVRDLYLAADVLVTDYSSTMFDFAMTGRPILLFAWDLEDYRDVLRGFYLDFDSVAPGPILRTGHDLTEALLALPEVARDHAESLNTFRRRFCALEDGNAAARIWDTLEGNF